MAVDRFGRLWVNELSGIRLYDFDRKKVVRYDDYRKHMGGYTGRHQHVPAFIKC